MEPTEPKITNPEEAVLFTDADFSNGLENFQIAAERAVGQDPHREHINFKELDEQDLLLAEQLMEDELKANIIKEAKDHAVSTGQKSSAAFRGWLAGLLGRKIMRQDIESRKQRST